jgi:hypothetical protein
MKDLTSSKDKGWSIAPESATQSWTEVGGGWSAMVLKEWASDYWSQPALTQGFQPGEGAGAAATAAVGQVGTWVMDRGPAWPLRPANAAVLWASDQGRWSYAPATGGCKLAMACRFCR